MAGRTDDSLIRPWAERSSWCLGAGFLAVFVVARILGSVAASRDLDRFEEARATAAARVDTSLWSEGRKSGYRASLGKDAGLPLGVLRISRVGLEVAVLDGTDEVTLNRGVGRILGTARPGERGNIGIAGHRDGFFRVLKDVAEGDVIEMETLARVERYTVVSTAVVEPEDVSLLAPTAEPCLTLVTCFPFYFVGSAPQRFVVRAVPVGAASETNAPGAKGAPDARGGGQR